MGIDLASIYDDTEARRAASAVASLRSEVLKLRESTLGLRCITRAQTNGEGQQQQRRQPDGFAVDD